MKHLPTGCVKLEHFISGEGCNFPVILLYRIEIAPEMFEHSGSTVIHSSPGASIQGKPSITKQVLSNLPIVIHCILHHRHIS